MKDAHLGLNKSYQDFSYSGDVGVDTNDDISLTLAARKNPLYFRHYYTTEFSNTSLTYDFYSINSLDHGSIELRYDTANTNDYFSSLIWKDSSLAVSSSRRQSWQYRIGLGKNNDSIGFISSLSSELLQGLFLSANVNNISISANDLIFNLNLIFNFYVQPKLALGTYNASRLRGEGGLFIEPFYDQNNNGIHDANDSVFQGKMKNLFYLNNKPIRVQFDPVIGNKGSFYQLKPGLYHFQIDPAAAPIGWVASETSLAVEVTAGSFTSVKVPFKSSNIIAGMVTNTKSEPLAGIQVQAILINSKRLPYASVTNSAGIYYLENIQRGKYFFKINGQPYEHSEFEINQDSKPLIEVNFKNIQLSN